MEIELNSLLKNAVEKRASDLFIISGSPIILKLQGRMTPCSNNRLTPNDTRELIETIYKMADERSITQYVNTGDDDFSFSVSGLGRFRCNVYRQRGSMAAVLRVMSYILPDPYEMHIPHEVTDLFSIRKGLVLITGSAGSGKSTTLACLIDLINRTYQDHIITIEDPIEFLHSHNKSIVSQREVPNDTLGYAEALRAALRESPDVILLGEMRDFETIQTAITAAETGQLVLSTLHTVGVAKTVDRVIDVFPSTQQQQVRIQLSMVLQAVVSQQLVPTVDGSLYPAFEVMRVNSAIRNLIRDNKTHQIDNMIYAGGDEGMITMDGDLTRLWREGIITKETALKYSSYASMLEKKLK